MKRFSTGARRLARVLTFAAAAAALPALAAEQGGDSQLVPSAKPPWEQPSAVKPPPPSAPATAPAPAKPASAEPATAPPSSADTAAAAAKPLLAVVKWSFSASLQHESGGGLSIAAAAGRPLYLWLTIRGGQAALDRLQTGEPIAIDVHWAREAAGPGAAAPDLVTKLTIGRPGLAATLAGQVKSKGYFEWRLWSRKDALSPGRWTVSLTYPDGQPVQCGEQQPQPCKLPIEVS